MKSKKVLVTGGAGYIGSFTVLALKKAGYEPIVFDNLETGNKKAIVNTKLYVGDLKTDVGLLEKVIKKEKPKVVLHFAAYIEAGESVKNPPKYFFNNVVGTLNLLQAMLKGKVLQLVYSSSAAVYGQPKKVPIKEDAPRMPSNPYGETKLMIENILGWYRGAHGLSSICLRYFNAAGAALDGSSGQDYPRPTHLITRACEAALGKRKKLRIHGNDYDTSDGTCIRDYIHVLDLADVHVLALEFLKKNRGFSVYNVGTGRGCSVFKAVEMVKKITKVSFPVLVSKRRQGDPVRSVASAKKIRKELGFKPKYSDLETIVKSAWEWHKNNPNGYK